jgi:hypothetical protein
MTEKYLYQDYYKTMDEHIFNYINTDIFSKDLKNDIYFIYGKSNNIFLFNNNDKEYFTIINYLNSKYQNEWNSHLMKKYSSNLLVKNLQRPIEDHLIASDNENIKGGNQGGEKSSVLLKTDIIYQICTPLFLAYQYQKYNHDPGFVNSFKSVFYASYNFAIENDPNRILKNVRGQMIQNGIKKHFNDIGSFFKKSDKLKPFKDSLKKRDVCHNIEEKFNSLKKKCNSSCFNFLFNFDNLFDLLMDSFNSDNKDNIPLEHKIKLAVYPSMINENKMNITVSDDVRGDTISNKISNVDEALAINPFLESSSIMPSSNLLQPVQQNVIDVILPNKDSDQSESELKQK